MSVTNVKGQARRGRPPQTEQEADRVRATIVAATATVFAEHGSRGMNVALILRTAGISRPTFYRYFANTDEPLNALLEESDAQLTGGVQAAIDSVAIDTDVAIVIAVVDAYLAWARARGAVLRPLFAELHDHYSPVSGHRVAALTQIKHAIVEKFTDMGRAAPDPLDLDTLINACEYLVYRVVTDDMDRIADGGAGDDRTAVVRATMIRLAVVVLGTTDDVRNALEIPGLFHEPTG